MKFDYTEIEQFIGKSTEDLGINLDFPKPVPYLYLTPFSLSC